MWKDHWPLHYVLLPIMVQDRYVVKGNQTVEGQLGRDHATVHRVIFRRPATIMQTEMYTNASKKVELTYRGRI